MNFSKNLSEFCLANPFDIYKNNKPINKKLINGNEEEYQNKGKTLFKLAQSLNKSALSETHANNNGKKYKKLNIISLWGLTQLVSSLFGIRNWVDNPIEHQSMPPLELTARNIFPSPGRTEPFASLFTEVYHKISRLKDPLHFPCAEGGFIFTSKQTRTEYNSVHMKLYDMIMSERKEADIHSVVSTPILQHENSIGENLAYVINQVLSAIHAQNYESLAFRKIFDIVVGPVDNSHNNVFDGIKKIKLINHWIKQQIFGDDFNQYLSEIILKNRLQSHIMLLKLKQDVENRLDNMFRHLPPIQSHAVKNHVIEQIVNMEFPAFSYEFLHSTLAPFQWGLCHAGHYFLNKMSLDIQQFTDQQIYALGYTLYHLFREGLVAYRWVSFFSLPAMINYLHSVPHDVITTLSDTPLEYQKAALNAFFDNIHYKTTGDNPIMDLHKDIADFLNQTFKSTPLPPAPDLSRFTETIQRLALHYSRVDEIHLTAAFLLLKREDQIFINHALIKRGKFAYALPIQDIKNQDVHDNSINEYFKLTLFSPSYINIFKCSCEAESRIYALLHLPTGYSVKRIKNDYQGLYELLSDKDKIKYRDKTHFSTLFHDKYHFDLNNKGINNLINEWVVNNYSFLIDNLKKYSATDWSPKEMKQRLINLPLVPIHYCFDVLSRNNKQSPRLACANEYAVARLIPFDINITERDSMRGMARALNAQKSLGQAIAGLRPRFDDLSPASIKLQLMDIISYGVYYDQQNDIISPIYALNNIDIYKILTLMYNAGNGISKLKEALRKINVLTQDVYRKQPGKRHMILVSEDHTSPIYP